MSRFYTFAYAVGFMPWERAAAADLQTLPRLFAREEAEHGGPGTAMDLGCGSGVHTVALAERGWKVTGVDLVPKALDRARKRIAEHGVTADVVRADVTDLRPETVGSGYDLFLDIGCFHDLSASQRMAMGAGVSTVAAPDASLLMLVFKRARSRGRYPAAPTRATSRPPSPVGSSPTLRPQSPMACPNRCARPPQPGTGYIGTADP